MKQREITCQDCGTTWMRPIKKGPLPKRCRDCQREAKLRAQRRAQTIKRACAECGKSMTTREKQRRGSRRMLCFECAPLGYHSKKVLGRVCGRDGCDRSLDEMTAPAKFCSTECGEYARGQRKEATERTCPVCRRSFTASDNKRFCPPKPGKARSWCAKAYGNAKVRGTLDRLLAEPRTPPQPFDCECCGKHCVPGENVAHHASMFCGQDCKGEWHRVLDPNGRYAAAKEREAERRQREAPLRRRTRRRRDARRRLGSALDPGPVRQWFEGRCKGCGERYVASHWSSRIAHYCSEGCRNREARTRRRARKRDAFVEEVWRPVLFERDVWTCQLCGDPVDPDLKYPDQMAATIDHIVPLSRGGEHSYANTQLAHALCNTLKGDREAGSMLFAA